jgi:ParB family chromosome partitioning protein
MIALDLDMAEWWEATPENYLSHVSKDRILEVVAEVALPGNVDLMRGLKKQELIRQADEELRGSRWLPDNLKTGKTQKGE